MYAGYSSGSRFLQVEIPFGICTRVISAGSYRDVPVGAWGINLTKEIEKPSNVRVKIPDFSVPSHTDMEDAIRETLFALARQQPVYVGCMGGIGRTGMFLSCLVKAINKPADPVAWVRKYYLSHAVETTGQRAFIAEFNAKNQLRWDILLAKGIAPFYGRAAKSPNF